METVIVRSDELAEYLERHGLRVVGGSFRRGERRASLTCDWAKPAPVSDAQPPAEPERKESGE